MIGMLKGTLVSKQPPQLLLDVNGVGYEIEAPMSTFFQLPEVGKTITLHTHLTVREDAHLLYGFSSDREKQLFRAVIKVSGIGPKIGLAILSGTSADEFWEIVRAGDVARLVRVPGIGKKTGERLLIEMRDKADSDISQNFGPVTGSSSPIHEARGALLSLGYKAAEVQKLTDAAYKDGMTAEEIIRESLKRAVR